MDGFLSVDEHQKLSVFVHLSMLSLRGGGGGNYVEITHDLPMECTNFVAHNTNTCVSKGIKKDTMHLTGVDSSTTSPVFLYYPSV